MARKSGSSKADRGDRGRGLVLLVTAPSGHTSSLRLEGRRIFLGRSATNTLSFPEDEGLSRQHLFVDREGDQWFVQNLASKNGTFVNGALVTSRHDLEPGDRITASCVTLALSRQSRGVSVRSEPPDAEAQSSTESTSLEEVLSAGRSQSRIADEARGPHVSALWAFVRAGRELAVRRPLQELFRIILDLSLEAVGAERGVLLTLDEGDRLVVQASRGPGLQISARVRDKVLKEKTSLLVTDALHDQLVKRSQTIIEQGVHSLIAVPLQTEERVIGLMYLDSVDKERTFRSDDLSLLTAMANVAGIRIERERWEMQRRVLIAENVESLGRLAAALSHELNTPLGTLKSTVDTLVRAAARRGSATSEERGRLEAVQADLRKSLDAALERMEEVIGRIQRFTNLDRAEVQTVDLNELLSDVVALAQEPSIDIELRSVPLPSIRCHRQSLSSSLTGLLRCAIEACRRNDAYGKIVITTEASGDRLVIRIEDNGGGMTPDQVTRLFNPAFQIADGRISTGDWGLFTARQVVQKQGGEIRVHSQLGKGSTFVVSVPSK
ncbi:MAG TPA: ATP-binding protein [Vicinamibacteria bacterium]|nr:ATP-binding protein [Vicinamibacteria bacterium]